MNKVHPRKNFMPFAMIEFSVAAYIIGLLFVEDAWGWTQGILFGLLFSLLKLGLMHVTFHKAVKMSEARAKVYATTHYVIRYILTGIVLLVAALEPSINLLGVILGLISMKAAAYMQIGRKKGGK